MSELDLPGTFSSSITDADTDTDVDTDNVSILREQLKETDRLIALHNTFDVITVMKDITVEEQIIANKLLVNYLRGFRNDLSKKVEELTNG